MFIKNTSHNFLYDYKVSKENIIKLKNLKRGDKPSIVSDVYFKTLFLPEARKKYSAHLISLLVDIDENILIDNLQIVNSELNKTNIYKKGERCDYVAKIDNTFLNIEVNNNKNIKNLERNLEYAFRLFTSNVNIGTDYKYNQVIQVNINNFSFKELDNTYTVNYLQDDKGIILTDKIIIINIYLPNVIKKCYTQGISKLNDLETYLYSLAEYDEEKLSSIARDDEIVEDLISESKTFTLDEDLREAYDHEQADKEQEYEYGFEDGMEKGIEKGKEQGKEQSKKESAINFYNNGVSKEVICKSLNITEEQLEDYLK